MADSHIPTRARSRNTIDYPLEQDTPGANALVVRELEWWARPATPAKKTAYLALHPETEHGANQHSSRSGQLGHSSETPENVVRFTKEAAHALPWWVALFLAFFTLGVVSYEAVVSPGHSLTFLLTRDLVAGIVLGNASIVAASLRKAAPGVFFRWVLWSTVIIGAGVALAVSHG